MLVAPVWTIARKSSFKVIMSFAWLPFVVLSGQPAASPSLRPCDKVSDLEGIGFVPYSSKFQHIVCSCEASVTFCYFLFCSIPFCLYSVCLWLSVSLSFKRFLPPTVSLSHSLYPLSLLTPSLSHMLSLSASPPSLFVCCLCL